MKMRKRLSARGLSLSYERKARTRTTGHPSGPLHPRSAERRGQEHRPARWKLHQIELGAPDHVVLEAPVELDEVRAETADADHQVPVGLGVELCVPEQTWAERGPKSAE